jgi:hypothetical protein
MIVLKTGSQSHAGGVDDLRSRSQIEVSRLPDRDNYSALDQDGTIEKRICIGRRVDASMSDCRASRTTVDRCAGGVSREKAADYRETYPGSSRSNEIERHCKSQLR